MEFIKSIGEEYQVAKRGCNIMAVVKSITWIREAISSSPYNIKAVGKNIKWGIG